MCTSRAKVACALVCCKSQAGHSSWALATFAVRVSQATVSPDALATGIPIVDLLSEVGGFLPSKGEARRALKENSIALNKDKVPEDRLVTSTDLMGGRFILLQRGKKNYFLVRVG